MTKRPQSLPESDPLLGKTLDGRFLVQELIDRGGMGKVYRAVQQPLGRPVALKTLDLLDPRGEFRERFFNEASVCSRLTHPNTVRIFDYGRSEDGVYFLTMELLDGRSLHKVVKSEAPMDPLRVIAIIRQVCGALHEAHEQGIVHRDLKPGNIFLTRHGDDAEFAKVLDFGLVKDLDSDVNLSQTGQALGSPLYMSPEQVEGDPVDRRSDVYALGLVLYVALTGRVPFKKGSVATIMMQQVTGTIPTFDEISPGHAIPFSLEWVVRSCIEKKPDHRIATMRELSRALKICAAEIRGELSEPVEWKLGADGLLDLQPGLTIGKEDTNIPTGRPAAAPLANVQVMSEIPSSPTLNRSVSTTVATGAALAGGGLLMLGGGLVVVALLIMLVVGAVLYTGGETTVPTAVPTEEPAPVAPPADPIVGEVRIASEPSGAEVLRDGSLLGTTPLAVKLEDGPVELEIHAEGFETRRVRADGTVDHLTVPLKREKLQLTPPPRPPPRPNPRPQPVAPEPEPTPRPGTPNMTEIRNPWEDG